MQLGLYNLTIPDSVYVLLIQLDTSMTIEEVEFLNISAPPSPQTPRFAGSPSRDLDCKNLELSPLRLKDTPVRG